VSSYDDLLALARRLNARGESYMHVRPAALEALILDARRWREALAAIGALEPMELNPSNYDHDIACEVSRNAAHAAVIASNALEGEQ
jgi:hypothetical protein